MSRRLGTYQRLEQETEVVFVNMCVCVLFGDGGAEGRE